MRIDILNPFKSYDSIDRFNSLNADQKVFVCVITAITSILGLGIGGVVTFRYLLDAKVTHLSNDELMAQKSRIAFQRTFITPEERAENHEIAEFIRSYESWFRGYKTDEEHLASTDLALSNDQNKKNSEGNWRPAKIPNNFGKLSSLENLSLNGFTLSSLPPSIGNLSGLKNLVIYDTPPIFAVRDSLTTVPECIMRLSGLNRLYLGNIGITSLPENLGNLSVLNELDVKDTQISTLPESLGNLSELRKLILNRNKLTSLPEGIGNLSELQSIYLNRNQLTSLPEGIGNLTKLSELHLASNGLSSLPTTFNRLTSLQFLDLSRNRFTTVPEILFSLPVQCQVDLTHNLIPQAEVQAALARINSPGYTGPKFIFSIYEPPRPVQPSIVGSDNTYSLDKLLTQFASPLASQFIRGQNDSMKNSLKNWLGRLADTQDYKTDPNAVKDKINDLLNWLATTQGEEKEKAFQLIQEATASCGDRVALSVNDLSLMKRLSQASSLPLVELKDLIIGFNRLEDLNKIARQKCESLKGVDEIEVFLAYQTGLKEKLNLPVEVKDMLYRACSNVKQEDLDSAQNKIMDSEDQLTILLANPVWLAKIEKDEDFIKLKNAIEAEKQEYLDSIDTTDLKILEQVAPLIKEKELRDWNPYYAFTLTFTSK